MGGTTAIRGSLVCARWAPRLQLWLLTNKTQCWPARTSHVNGLCAHDCFVAIWPRDDTDTATNVRSGYIGFYASEMHPGCAQLLSDSVTPWTVARQAPCPWDFPGKNTGVGFHFLLQGLFPTQGSNLRLLHWRAGSSPLRHQGRTPWRHGKVTPANSDCLPPLPAGLVSDWSPNTSSEAFLWTGVLTPHLRLSCGSLGSYYVRYLCLRGKRVEDVT